jgi:hypothetical protein
MLQLLVHLQTAVLAFRSDRVHSSIDRSTDRPSRRLAGTRGQATVEYALVLLGAAALALLVASWAAKTDAIGKLMNFVLGHVMGLGG